MNRFRELLSSISVRPSTVVHLGAGDCAEYEFFKSISANHVLFTESDPLLATRAETKFKDVEDVSILATAISTSNHPQTLYVTNNRRFSSLLEPGKLLEYYPNLEVIDTVVVETTTLEDLCQSQGIDGKVKNLLVADLRGLEKDVFHATNDSVLQNFECIIIRSSQLSLYESTSDRSIDELKKGIGKAGYTVLVFAEESPPFMDILCLRNDVAVEVEKLRARDSELSSKFEVLEGQLESANETNRSLTAECEQHSRTIANLNETIQRRNKEFEELQKSLTINNKLLLKADADLKDLQLQYRAALRRQEEQMALLMELKKKLRQAAEFYKQADLQNLVLSGDLLEPAGAGSEDGPDVEDE
jgi:hypothetical protein